MFFLLIYHKLHSIHHKILPNQHIYLYLKFYLYENVFLYNIFHLDIHIRNGFYRYNESYVIIF